MVDLREFLAVLRAQWLAVTAIAVLGGLAALAYSLVITPQYSATTQLYVTSSGGDSAGAAYQGSLASQQRVQSYAELVSSRDVLQQVRDRAGVDFSTEDLQGMFGATAEKDTVLLNVTASDTDPGRARLLADMMGAVLTDYVSELETPAGGGDPLAKLSIVGPAAFPTAPDLPKTERNTALGFICGLGLGVGLAVLRSTVDRRIKSKEELEKVAGAPMVGAIPTNNERVKAPAVPFREGYSPEAEAYRALRTNIQFLDVDNQPKVILVTSSVPGEGKSTTTLNIGLVLAEAGHKVLIVEADLRRPRIARYMELNDKIGFTNVLTGQAEEDDVIQETQWDGLSLLACGPTPPNPSELLGSRTTGRVIDRLRTNYDFILIDSPPAIPVTDASILSKLTDGVLVIVRSHSTTTDQLNRTGEMLRLVDARVLGTVLTLTKFGSRRHGYYYDGDYNSDSDGGLKKSIGSLDPKRTTGSVTQ